MTCEEALKHVENIKNGGDEFTEDYHDSLQIAINALEKAIPKTPKAKFSCPTCASDLNMWNNEGYCPVCGQKLDWESFEHDN